MTRSPSIGVVVPMYDEATVVGDVVSALRREFPLVVCVDDGSRDQSGAVASRAGAVVLTHRVNLGAGGALQTGLDYLRERAEVEHVVSFDADGQHRVVDAVAMVRTARETGVDVVLGTRVHDDEYAPPISRRLLLSAALRYSRWNSGLALTDTHNGLRVFNRRALEVIRLRQRGMAHASELESLIAAHGLSWVEHEVVISYTEYSRAKGQVNLNAVNILYDLTLARLSATP